MKPAASSSATVSARRGDVLPDRSEASGRRQNADRIDAEIEVVGREILAPALRQRAHQPGHFQAAPAGVDPQGDQGQHHALQRRVEVFDARGGQAVAAGARGARKGQDEGVGPAFEVDERLCVGGGEIGVIDPLRDAPGARLTHRLGRRGGGSVEGFDPQAVGRVRHQPLLEIGALEDAFDEAEPARPVYGLEEVGERCVFHRNVPERGVFCTASMRLPRTPLRRWQSPDG